MFTQYNIIWVLRLSYYFNYPDLNVSTKNTLVTFRQHCVVFQGIKPAACCLSFVPFAARLQLVLLYNFEKLYGLHLLV